tara:strand:+ start:1958 stop:2446 length:489 start_codon:yes stop_codon:yes gene_type:complete
MEIKYKVVDNFLPINYFKKIQSLLLNARLEWYYKDYSSYVGGKDGHSFVHVFWGSGKKTSNFLDEFNFLLEKLKVKHLLQLRANMLIRDSVYAQSDLHVDYDSTSSTTAILYINTNNGYTILNGKKIESVENRLLIFPVNVKHASIRQTDTNRRIVLNINYT